MIRTEWVNGTGDGFAEVCAIRRAVYEQELGMSKAFVQDEFDPMSAQLLVRDEDGSSAATGRLYPRADGWRIGRIAVLPDRRGKRLGDLAIRLLFARAFDTVPDSDITVLALPHAASLYEKFGFVREAQTLENGAPVISMRVHAASFDWHRPCEQDHL